MKYKNITKATFLKRPNRFIAHCLLNQEEVICHVKNTGRCKELLIEGATVYLEKSDNPNRKTAYSLVAVEKNGLLINMDSQAPNKIAYDAILDGTINLGDNIAVNKLKREVTYKDSRFDLAFTDNHEMPFFCEVKGVTLEENGIAMFPDAPTERGIKHIHGLIDAKQNGMGAAILFIIQMDGVKYFTPNNATHSQFGKALLLAKKQGVQILAYECSVTSDSIFATKEVEIIL